jgi:hypothetical protein
MKKQMLSAGMAALLILTSVAQAAEVDLAAVVAKQNQIIQAQKEIDDLTTQLENANFKRNVEVVVAFSATLGTVAAAGLATIGSISLGYEGRQIRLSEKIGLGAFVATPAVIGATSAWFAHLNSNDIDVFVANLKATKARLSEANSALETLKNP